MLRIAGFPVGIKKQSESPSKQFKTREQHDTLLQRILFSIDTASLPQSGEVDMLKATIDTALAEII